jgi:hypothetical protein
VLTDLVEECVEQFILPNHIAGNHSRLPIPSLVPIKGARSNATIACCFHHQVAQLEALEERSQAEEARWEKEKARLEAALRRARG